MTINSVGIANFSTAPVDNTFLHQIPSGLLFLKIPFVK